MGKKMRSLCGIVFSIAVLCAACESQEKNEEPEPELQTALYNQEKEPIAYIDYEDEATIYTFEGEPLAYLESEEQVYGFNGKFLGWYWEGVLYDRSHYAVGAKQGIARGEINTFVTRPEKVKGVKQVKPVRHVPEIPLVRPVLKDHWSETSLKDFLNKGKKD